MAAQLGLALAIATLLFLPHGLWLLGRAASNGPLAYAMHTAKPTGFGGHSTLAAMQTSVVWLLDLVLNRCLPALLLLLVVKGFVHRSRMAMNSSSLDLHKPLAVTPDKFLLLWGLLPTLSVTALGMTLGMDLQKQWGTAFALWLVPAAMVLLRLQRIQPTRGLIWAALATFLVLQAALLIESYSTSAAGCCTNDKWRNFDSPRVASELDTAAREQAGGRFRVLVGPVNTVGAIAMALPDQPRVLIDARTDISPWVGIDELFGSGVVQLIPPDKSLPGASRLPSGWSWRIFTPEDL